MLDVKKAYSYIKMSGYAISKDALGSYFDKDDVKFSVMRTGNWYNCFYNVRVDNQWVLKNKSQIFSKFEEALDWVIREMNSNVK